MTTQTAPTNVVDAVALMAGVDATDKSLRAAIARRLVSSALRAPEPPVSERELDRAFAMLANAPFNDVGSRIKAARASSPELSKAIDGFKRRGRAVGGIAFRATLAAALTTIDQGARASMTAREAAAIASLTARVGPTLIADAVKHDAARLAVARQRALGFVRQIATISARAFSTAVETVREKAAKIAKFFSNAEVFSPGGDISAVAKSARVLLAVGVIGAATFGVVNTEARADSLNANVTITSSQVGSGAASGLWAPRMSTETSVGLGRDRHGNVLDGQKVQSQRVPITLTGAPALNKQAAAPATGAPSAKQAWNPRQEMAFDDYNAMLNKPSYNSKLGDRQPSAAFIDLAAKTLAASLGGDRDKADETVSNLIRAGESCMELQKVNCTFQQSGIVFDFANGEYSATLLPVQDIAPVPTLVASETFGKLVVGSKDAYKYVGDMERAADIGGDRDHAEAEVDEVAPAPH